MKMDGFDRVTTTSERIKEALKLRDMRQTDLAKATNIDKGSISSYISGRYEPKNEAIHKMASALSVSEMWLWGYDVPIDRPADQRQPSSPTTPLQLTDREEHLVVSFRGLNSEGQEKAIERVDELLDVPRYRMDDPLREDADRVVRNVLGHYAKKCE